MNDDKPPVPPGSAELVARIKNGDRAAELLLIKRFSRGLMVMLKGRTGDVMLAEDLHQDTFVTVLQRLREQSINEPEKLPGFIHKTAVNKYLGWLRTRNRRQTYADTERIDVEPDSGERLLKRVLAEESQQVTRDLINEIKNNGYRELLWRTYVLDQPKKTVCAEMKCSSRSFDQRISRARNRFAELIEARQSDDDDEGCEK